MIVVSGIITALSEDISVAIDKAQKLLNIDAADIKERFVVKTSIDARHRKQPQFVSSIGFTTYQNEEKIVRNCNNKNITFRKLSDNLTQITYGDKVLTHRPVIAGFGPAGMFAGLVLAQNGYSPIIIERGEGVDKRVESVEKFWKFGKLNTQSNVQFGEGGAGTFSDGKLTTRINDPLCDYVLKEFVRFGAPDEIIKKAKPHIGTDNLRNIVKEIKNEIIKFGGEVLTNAQLTEISLKNGNLESISINGNSFACSALFLAIGHSARDTFEMLMQKSILFEAKPFSIGVRIEHLQSDINNGLYGKYAGHPMLSQGEYQMSLRKNDRAVYTFCMCPGGFVVPSSSEQDTVVTNGMSEFARDRKNANSALVVSVSPKDFGENPRDAIEFQRKYERAAFKAGGGNYLAPAQTVGCFLEQKIGLEINRIEPSYSLGVNPCDFNAIFPSSISSMMRDGILAFGRKIQKFDANDAILTGIETRTSSPVRILRDENHEAVSAKGLYPCGEGAGYAGGIMSAAVDGIKTALKFMQKYGPIK
ncbi:MAG: hypothetical protein UHH95_03305 [Oscillospiraceae bacterium]|nr:hypothetical protein [Oscillospiraceae bacterium]